MATDAVGTPGTDLFHGEWGRPDKQILVIEGSGIASEIKHIYEQPGIQILVRGRKKQASRLVYNDAKVVFDYVVCLQDTGEINGTAYTGFEVFTPLTQLGKDENERFVYTMNFLTYRDA